MTRSQDRATLKTILLCFLIALAIMVVDVVAYKIPRFDFLFLLMAPGMVLAAMFPLFRDPRYSISVWGVLLQAAFINLAWLTVVVYWAWKAIRHFWRREYGTTTH